MAPAPTAKSSLWPRVLLSLLVCGGLGAALQAPRGEAPPAPSAPSAPSAPASPRAAPSPPPAAPLPAGFSQVGPAGDFPRGAARRFRSYVDGHGIVAVSTQGRVVRGGQVSGDDWHLLDPDPRTYGRRLRAVPEYREILAWVARGGDPARLPEGPRADLEAADRAYLAAGLLPPFEPYLAARPGSGGRLEPVRWGSYQAKVFEAGPWGWAAGESLHGVLEFTRDFGERLTKNPVAALGMPVFEGASLLGAPSVHAILVGVAGDPQSRPELARVVREAVRGYRITLVRAARSLRREPDTAERLAVTFGKASVFTAALHYTEVADMSLEQLLGLSPRSAPELFLAASVFREASFGNLAMGGEEDLRWGREQALWRLAASDREEGHGARLRARQARRRLVEVSTRLRDHEALAELIDQYESVIRKRPAHFGSAALARLASVVMPRDPASLSPYLPRHQEVLRVGMRRFVKRKPAHPDCDRMKRWLKGS